eukprot:Skav220176  [mRNA]  locus=scaffold1271:111342:114304:+ [translate_table: standard]
MITFYRNPSTVLAWRGSSVGTNAFTPVQLGSPDAFPLEGAPEVSSLDRLKLSAEATMQKAQAKERDWTPSQGAPRLMMLANDG